MADADYFLDLSSSPDPLADDIPSSVRPATRRITKSQHDLSSFAIPQSSPRRGLRAQSPRKRTFQLDVGHEGSPQRIRVTVEAEEAEGRDSVNRNLFPPLASPTKSARNTKSPRRREAITTTTVPLNDEDEEGDHVSTPRRRGRPRRTSNGTPMPRGRKRAGTPIQRKSKHARHEDERPSETGILMDASTDVAVDGGPETLQPRPRARATPKRQPANASVPSSQASGKTTGRKRGRPRKVPIPEEPAVFTETEPQANEVITSNTSASGLNTQQHDREASPNTGRDRTPDWHHKTDSANHTLNTPPSKKSNSTSSPSHLRSTPNTARINRSSGSPSDSHQELPESDHYMLDEDHQGMEPQSDLQSMESEDGMTHHRRDTIADASDFSMIAVESLPSFQASFQASYYREDDQPASDYPEMGEETSRIISQTLGSLRRSLQTETEGASHGIEDESNLKSVGNRDQDQDRDEDETPNQSTITTSYSSERGFAKSPRRLKQLPLSRKVFVGRGNVDDTFSSIPDSILHAATPGRPPIDSATREHEAHGGEDGAYDDSFSEIPEAVLEAATPRPARRVELSTRESPPRDVEPTLPTGQRSSLDYDSRRLPTPDDTSSSNAGSRKLHEEDAGAVEPPEQPSPFHRTDVPSSPPPRARPRALDFGYSNLQRELISVKERGSSSPQRQPTGHTATHQLQSLEPPLPPARPSLSPIVRAGRTLQNVMSDNSSPEGREVNLGSPFRGSMSSEYPRQSSAPRSPSPSIRNRGLSNISQLPTGSPAQLKQSFGSNLSRKSRGAPLSSHQDEDTSHQNNSIHSRRDSVNDSPGHRRPGLAPAVHNSSMVSSIRVSPPSADEGATWAPHSDNLQGVNSQQPSSQPASFPTQRTAENQSIDANQAATAEERELHLSHGGDLYDDSTHTMEEDIADSFDGHADGDNDGNDESDHVNDDDDDDDVDIWDIEASRTSPGKREPARTVSRESKSDAPPSRRSKVPSPWRRNNRRLIFKDDIASSSQIEIEESPQSESEEYPPSQTKQRPLAPQRQQDTQIRAPDLEPVQKSQTQEEPHDREESSPSPIHDDYDEHAGLADSDEPDIWMEDEEPGVPEQPQAAVGPIHEETEHVIQEEPEDVDMPTVPEASMDMSEYSMLARQAKQVPKPQEKPVQSKPGFFGGFDILSFFSSPATLPRNRPSGSNLPSPANNPAAVQPTQETRQPKEPPRALWSTGLFPSIPNNDSEGSSGRRANLFPPSSNLRSSDTVADTYEPSTTASPSLSHSRSESAAPSTPERQVFPPIEQTRDFTPRPGQSGGSLFAPSEANSSASLGGLNDGLEGSSSDEHDSDLAESSEYERVPPREKPSQWDRNLSPSKSCFRSPLKPTTPGRIVAFSNSALSPTAQAQTQAQTHTNARNALESSTNTRNTISQGPPLRRLTFEDKTVPKPSTTSRASQPSRGDVTASSAATMTAPPSSQTTTWSKQHWQRLDEILQLRRRDPSSFQLPPLEKRASSALLGKEVVAHATRLILEPWHLDVVEAFKLEVGGEWDETALAKRVFALIKGEEKRRATAAAAATTTR